MDAPRTLFIADKFAESVRDEQSAYPGGAEQTDQAVLEAAPWPVARVAAAEATPVLLERFDLHVVGNLQSADSRLIATLAHLGRHVLFEHDLRICNHRGNFPAALDPVHRFLGRCTCRHRRLQPVIASALGMIFLTRLQQSAYRSNPFFKPPESDVLGSPVFAQSFFERIARLKRGGERRDTCIAWSAQRIKGFRAAREWCRRRGIEPQVIRRLNPPAVLDLMQRCHRFVFLPTQMEPAGRMPVEARFLGCEVVVNRHVGVTGEPWWRLPDAQALEVLKDAGPRFWRLVCRFQQTRALERKPAGNRLPYTREAAC
jgi:hypothetical protein